MIKVLLLFFIIFVNVPYVRGDIDPELFYMAVLWHLNKPNTRDGLRDANFFYKPLLKQWESDSIKLHWQWGFSWRLCDLATLDNILRNNKSIDSVAVITIAVASAEKHYGFKMTPLGAKLVGNNQEHWIVYCFPTIKSDIRKQETCYRELVHSYEAGRLSLRSLTTGTTYCPKIVTVLISRENGQVLAVGTENVIRHKNGLND